MSGFITAHLIGVGRKCICQDLDVNVRYAKCYTVFKVKNWLCQATMHTNIQYVVGSVPDIYSYTVLLFTILQRQKESPRFCKSN